MKPRISITAATAIAALLSMKIERDDGEPLETARDAVEPLETKDAADRLVRRREIDKLISKVSREPGGIYAPRNTSKEQARRVRQAERAAARAQRQGES